MATLYHQVHIKAPQHVVYEAISTVAGIGSWWDQPEAVESEAGTVLQFHPGERHGVLSMRVVGSVSGESVEWECISTHPKSSPASAWTGTHVLFELGSEAGVTVLDFRHSGWDESSEYFGFCNYHWGEALGKLQRICEAKCS